MANFKGIKEVAKKSISDFSNHEPLQLASSTAFFCLFALPPILIILTTIIGIFLNDLSGNIYNQLSTFLGESGAEEIEGIIENFRALAEDTLTTILVSLFLLFIATNLFMLVRKNINQLWGIRVTKSPGFIAVLRDRMIAIAQVLIGGAVILVALLVDGAVAFIGGGLDSLLPTIGSTLIQVLQNVLSVIVVTIWFTLLYKILPNAYIHWKPALVGGLITSILFTIGKFILGISLLNSDIGSIFGASGSIILVLLFIFYSSLVFYLGASFTKNYGSYINQSIEPDKYAEKAE